MYFYQQTKKEDIYNIKANKWLDINKELIAQCVDITGMQTLFNDDEIVAIALYNEFHPRLYSAGFILKENPTIKDLKKVKLFVESIKDKLNADYIYSECVKCPVRDRFHKFVGFEVEKDLGTYKKWKFKNLKY